MSKTNLQIHTAALYKLATRVPVHKSILEIVMKTIGWITNLEGKERLLRKLAALKEDLGSIREKAVELAGLVNGMSRIDTSDKAISMTHLQIIENGDILEKYKTAKDLEGVDEVTRKLHKISFLYHRCAAERLYDCRFPAVNENLSNKKAKIVK